MSITYNSTLWQNEKTPLNESNMNNIESGVRALVYAINNMPDWVLSNSTPPWATPSGIGAETKGTAERLLAAHNISNTAHEGYLAPKIHTHTLSQITDFPTVTSADNNSALVVVNGAWAKKALAGIAFTANYSDLNNTPTIPTRTSQLTNDSGYITLKDVRQTMTGEYAGGYITTQQTMFCGFLPNYITIVEKNERGVTTSVQSINSDYAKDGVEIHFTDTGFTMKSEDNGTFNKTNYTYSWTAVSEGFRSLPSVTNADNGKVLTVVDGAWSPENPTGGLPSVSTADDGKVLGVQNGAWTAYQLPSQLPAVTSADAGKILVVDSSGNWVAQSLATWQGGSY